jgi:hypothetical protein
MASYEIKMDLQEIGCEDANYTEMVHNHVWSVLAMVNLQVWLPVGSSCGETEESKFDLAT